MTRTTHTFDIREPQHLDQLKPHTGKTKDAPSQHVRACPLCDGKLTIATQNGAFTCQTSHCDPKEITKVLTRSSDSFVVSRGTPSAPQIPAKNLDIGCVFSMPRFGGIVTLSDATKTRYDYGNGKCVYRLAKSSREKTFWYAHTNTDGEERKGKGDGQWEPYLFSWFLTEFTGDTLFLVEGQKCQEAMIKAGFYALNTKEFLADDFSRETVCAQMFGKGVRSAVVIADDDKAGYGYAQTCATYMGQCKMSAVIISLSADAKEPGKGYDIADYIKENPDITYDAMKKKLEELFAAEVKRRQEKPVEVVTEEKIVKGKYGKAYDLIKEKIGHRLSFNQQTLNIELDGSKIETDFMRHFVYMQTSAEISEQDALSIVTELAKEKPYHPKQQGLISAVNKTLNLRLDVSQLTVNKDDILNVIRNVNPIDILNVIESAMSVAKKYFGCEDDLSNTVVFRWLIGGVARIFVPGCEMQTVLVLQGKQGLGKTRFFRTLAGDDHYGNYTGDEGEKDGLLKVHSKWIIEMGEIDGVFTRQENNKLKNFISLNEDTFREPYGRLTSTHPRRSVFCGSVNTEDYLRDATGNRRFWTVAPKVPKIDVESLALEADEIWAGAVLAWALGIQWWLTDQEDAALFESNKQWEKESPFHDDITDYLKKNAKDDGTQWRVSIQDVKEWFLKEKGERINSHDEHKLTADLKSRGFTVKKADIGAGRKNYWFRPRPGLFDEPVSSTVRHVQHLSSIKSEVMDSIEKLTQQTLQLPLSGMSSTINEKITEKGKRENIDIPVSVDSVIESSEAIVLDMPDSSPETHVQQGTVASSKCRTGAGQSAGHNEIAHEPQLSGKNTHTYNVGDEVTIIDCPVGKRNGKLAVITYAENGRYKLKCEGKNLSGTYDGSQIEPLAEAF